MNGSFERCVVLLLAAAAAALAHAQAPERATSLSYSALYSDADGESHFREGGSMELVLPGAAERADGDMYFHTMQGVESVMLTRLRAGMVEDWHASPQRMFVYGLEGEVEMTASDGTSRVVRPGDMLLLEDTSGRGHLTRVLGDSDYVGLGVLLGDAAPGPQDPLVFDTFVPGSCSPNGQPQGQCPPGELFRVRLVAVAEGLRSPRHIAFTPDGDLLITELAVPAGDPAQGNQAVQGRPGRVRLVRNGTLAPEPLEGWPTPDIDAGALWSIVVDPQFARNRFVYLYYVKKRPDEMVTRALARARLDDTTLRDVEEIFEVEPWIPGGPMAGRAAFGPDGMIYLTVNDHVEHDGRDGGGEPLLAQQLDNGIGKVLRIRPDGGIPEDNPFVGRPDADPAVFTYGQRNVTDFAWHPETGELWTTEIAPMGGDEINILHAGRNYGWPLVSLGKNYNQTELSENHWYRPGMDMPVMYWTPAISPSTLVWYTGDRLAPWQGQLFVGALNGQTLVRVAFDQPMPQAERRDSLFMSLGRRWRHVVQGPDGYLYALTEKRTLGGSPEPGDATSGVVYRIEPAE